MSEFRESGYGFIIEKNSEHEERRNPDREIRMWSQSDGYVDRELSSGGLAYERSHRESKNRESRGLVIFDIANAEIAMSEIPI